MAFHSLQSNFVAGILNRYLHAREDWQKYAYGIWAGQNVIVLSSGALYQRPGTRFIDLSHLNQDPVRLIPWKFNREQTYVLEFGDEVIAFIRDHGRVVDNTDAVYTLTSPFADTEIEALKHAEVADVMVLAHPDHWPKKLTRTKTITNGIPVWTIEDIPFIDGPYLDEYIDETLAITGGTDYEPGEVLDITASVECFTADMVGAHLRWQAQNGFWYWFKIASTTGTEEAPSDSCTATYMGAGGTTSGALPKDNNDTDDDEEGEEDDFYPPREYGPFKIGAWRADLGYPTAVTFHEQRLCFGGTYAQPQTVWGSGINDYYNFRPSMSREGLNYDGTTYTADLIADDDSFTFTLASDEVNPIRWLKSTTKLVIGTEGGVWTLSPSDSTSVITPTDVSAYLASDSAAGDVQGIAADGLVLYPSVTGRQFHELAYRWEAEKYFSPDIMRWAKHLGASGIKEVMTSKEPDPIVWCLLNNGALAGLTYLPTESVYAWHHHTTDGEILSTCGIYEGGRREYYWAVRRGSNVCIEYLEEPLEEETGDVADSYYVDSGLSYDGEPVAAVSGLGHLAGKTVHGLLDGIAYAPLGTVDENGEVAYPAGITASKAHIGLPYYSMFIPVGPVLSSNEGSAKGRIKRIVKLQLEFLRSVGCKVGNGKEYIQQALRSQAGVLNPFDPSEWKLQALEGFRPVSTGYGIATPLFSGILATDYEGDYDEVAEVMIVQDLPLPMKVLAALYEVEVTG